MNAAPLIIPPTSVLREQIASRRGEIVRLNRLLRLAASAEQTLKGFEPFDRPFLRIVPADCDTAGDRSGGG